MDSAETTSPEARATRRQLLRVLALSAAGAGIVLGARGLLGSGSAAPTAAAPASPPSSKATMAATVGDAALTQSSSSLQEIKVKVMYFQMPQIVNIREEYFVLQSPAHFRDLLANVLEEHPALSPMTSSMMILIDGVPAQPSMGLRDADEVDFIPAVAGG